MPETQRRAILLREWQGLTYKEISTELGLTQGAVETLIFRARRALAQGLEQDADTWKRRLRRGADVGGVFACVKALLGGGGAAAVKITATALAVATTAVAAATTERPKQDAYHLSLGNQPAPTTIHVTRAAGAEDSGADEHDTRALHGRPEPGSPRAQARGACRSPSRCPALQSAEATYPPAPDPTPAPTPHPSLHRPTRRLLLLPAIAAPAAAPSDNGKGKKDERTPLATTQPAETTPAPAPLRARSGTAGRSARRARAGPEHRHRQPSPISRDKPGKPEKPGKDK